MQKILRSFVLLCFTCIYCFDPVKNASEIGKSKLLSSWLPSLFSKPAVPPPIPGLPEVPPVVDPITASAYKSAYRTAVLGGPSDYSMTRRMYSGF
ncbi:hypothetical protein LUQ84_003014 [Hamiltosporidium tvaerminnensis]|nr:hypothetical protein LUQ84_003014 [Hamiltosporidium tvaerminnensis]